MTSGTGHRFVVSNNQLPGRPFVASLPARRLDLSVYLPIGSEEGQYEAQILREAETPVVTMSASVVLENRNIVLRLQTDLTRLDDGRYLLGLRKARFQWTFYPITLTR